MMVLLQCLIAQALERGASKRQSVGIKKSVNVITPHKMVTVAMKAHALNVKFVGGVISGCIIQSVWLPGTGSKEKLISFRTGTCTHHPTKPS